MSYRIAFVDSALKECRKLALAIADRFNKTKSERLAEPRALKVRLHQMPDGYKIRLRIVGSRLIYQVSNKVVTVAAVAMGKREKSEVYRAAREPESKWLADGNDEAAARRCVETAWLLDWGMSLALFSLCPTKLACSARKARFVRNFAELRRNPFKIPVHAGTGSQLLSCGS